MQKSLASLAITDGGTETDAEPPTPPRPARRWGTRAVAGALGILAAGLVGIATTPPAPGVTGDSIYHLGGAESLLISGKFQYPDARWSTSDTVQAMARTPPGLSIVLAALRSIGASEMGAARITQSVSAGVTVAVVVVLVAQLSGLVAGVLTALTILALPAFYGVHVYVLTEPLFIAATVLALWAVVSGRSATVVGLALLAAAITRYVGVSVAVGAGLAALFTTAEWRTRVLRGITIAGPAVLFFAVWHQWTAQAKGGHPIEVRGLFPLGGELAQAWQAIATWLVPGSVTPLRVIQVAAMIGCALAVLFSWRHRAARSSRAPVTDSNVERARQNSRDFLVTVVSMLVCYAAFVVLAHVLAEPGIHFRERMLFPTFVLAQVCAGALLIARIRRDRWARYLGTVALAIWIGVSARVSFARVEAEKRDGLEIASAALRASPTLGWLAENARGRMVFSNHPLAVYHHAKRSAKLWPARMLPDSTRALIARLSDRALLVAFVRPDPWETIAPAEEVTSAVPLEVVARLSDGTVYELDPSRAEEYPVAAGPSAIPTHPE